MLAMGMGSQDSIARQVSTPVAADRRDVITDARDERADERSNDLDRADVMDRDSTYGDHWPERRNAALDREHAKDDRTASRDDRAALTEDDDDPDPSGT
jgi:hypothetical protein